MRTLLNVLWVIFGGGLVVAAEYALAGLLLCLTVVGLPFGVACFRIAGLALWPFGRVVDRGPRPTGCLSLLANVLWLIVAGVWIFLSHVALAVGLAVTIIGIPFALQHLKIAVLALMPFGAEVRVAP